MKNRQALARHFAKLGYKVGAEIGVCTGYYSNVLCQTIPNLKLYGIDNWSESKGFNRIRNQGESSYEQTLNTLGPFIKSGQYIIIKKTSMEALGDFSDESLDFVFIDADHGYNFVKEDINGWSQKVREGGIVSGHDYYISKMDSVGVVQAVDEYVKEHNIELQLTEWNNTGRFRDNFQPSWYFIKNK